MDWLRHESLRISAVAGRCPTAEPSTTLSLAGPEPIATRPDPARASPAGNAGADTTCARYFRMIGINELTRLVVQRSADDQQGGADTGLAAGARERRLRHRVARPRSGRRSAACAAACRPAGPGSLAGTARQAASDGSGTVALPRQTQARCPRQAPARGLARFGRRPRGLPRSPPRRQRTTACRTPVVGSELHPRP